MDYFMFTVTGKTQAFAQGDKIPQLDNTKVGVTSASGKAAAATGNPNNLLYDTESMFDLRATSAAEKAHFRFLNGVDLWKVAPLNPDEAQCSADALDSFFASKDVNKLFWDKLFKDFPSLKTPFSDALKTEYSNYYREVARVAEDDTAVTALAEPFLLRNWSQNFIDPATNWRIVEKLVAALEAHLSKNNKYEKRAVRETLERITKIGLNSLEKQPWMHESMSNPLSLEVGGFRAWHEAGNW
jgi:hypothetical protein